MSLIADHFGGKARKRNGGNGNGAPAPSLIPPPLVAPVDELAEDARRHLANMESLRAHNAQLAHDNDEMRQYAYHLEAENKVLAEAAACHKRDAEHHRNISIAARNEAGLIGKLVLDFMQKMERADVRESAPPSVVLDEAALAKDIAQEPTKEGGAE